MKGRLYASRWLYAVVQHLQRLLQRQRFYQACQVREIGYQQRSLALGLLLFCRQLLLADQRFCFMFWHELFEQVGDFLVSFFQVGGQQAHRA